MYSKNAAKDHILLHIIDIERYNTSIRIPTQKNAVINVHMAYQYIQSVVPVDYQKNYAHNMAYHPK